MIWFRAEELSCPCFAAYGTLFVLESRHWISVLVVLENIHQLSVSLGFWLMSCLCRHWPGALLQEDRGSSLHGL